MDLYKILWEDAHWNINKNIAKKVGLHGALILANLISLEKFFWKKWQLVTTKKWGWFFSQTNKQLEEHLFIWRKPLERALKDLETAGFIEICVAGNPARKHFKINAKNILEFLLKADEEDDSVGQTSLSQTDKQDCPKGANKNAPNGQTINKEEKEERIKRKNNIKNKNTNVFLQKKENSEILEENQTTEISVYENSESSELEKKEKSSAKKEKKDFKALFLENLTWDFYESIKTKFQISDQNIKSSAENFILYWTEKNTNGRKEKWEMQKTFDIKRRFYFWLNNQKNFTNKNKKEVWFTTI